MLILQAVFFGYGEGGEITVRHTQQLGLPAVIAAEGLGIPEVTAGIPVQRGVGVVALAL